MGDDALDLCVTYALYTPLLQKTGYDYAPYIEVRYAWREWKDSRKRIAKKSGRATQYITYPDASYISAIYFHVVAAADMREGRKDHWISIEPERPLAMEVNVEEDDDSLRARSLRQWWQIKSQGGEGHPHDE